MNKILFLPTDYQTPKNSNFYMKFQEGENRFRILSQPIIGWEDWQNNKPVRFQLDQKPARSFDEKKPVKHFWSMIVWNYLLEEIQVLHITQATIRKSLESLCKDPDWGAPYFYDLKVTKTGEGIDTEYALTPLPHKPLHPSVQDAFNEKRCNLDALFTSEDPFSKENRSFTPGIFTQETLTPTPQFQPKITMDQAYQLEMILGDCEKSYKEWVYAYLKKQYNTDNLSDLPVDMYDRVKAAAVKNMQEFYIKQRDNAFPEPQLVGEIQ